MEYVYAALILNETDEEVNEENITAVLEAAGVDVEESRAKALVAALEDVDIEEAIETAAAAPAPAAGGAAGGEVEAAEADEAEEAEEAEEEAAEEEDEDEEADGEGLGALFG
ncbi:50S ribosomal protein P1 [Haloferax mediterranei ATCC 33500]|uniref:Large ribosomal subunit protein P1 n=1 Tax=Haloferax mediterranei (strain ATCC 33500 / DSM 1411 / JCM 8866 / NBRC 14739 / NCIMB 2177 / R-4) TaxID=523841 RepID=I3R883_HALMT|nr:50S ribosomal protein P1 [Haloferax mediterranei]AFK20443.1 50S ribosomal protein L12P [Haloferax mediterranei ATCC 33500]AHZ23804.1 50S ribosomal protein L12 [Haloferax mediterranei ATCC 33500]ELZ98227.1 50S ribosomal protein L12P [Haloferax mediterranei ATCC 33500]MDX5986801.1 50S ribosomal protein P1 [Haloferax mediterranei ATCC 33500]QCQ76125.1 50S ribosomal protein P1 [Haloferax mediterranei ATCC 33500]